MPVNQIYPWYLARDSEVHTFGWKESMQSLKGGGFMMLTMTPHYTDSFLPSAIYSNSTEKQ